MFPRPGAAFGLQDKPRKKRERENINAGCLWVAQLQTDQHKKHTGMLNNFDKRHLKSGAGVPPHGQGCKVDIYGQRPPEDFPAAAGGFWSTSLLPCSGPYAY